MILRGIPGVRCGYRLLPVSLSMYDFDCTDWQHGPAVIKMPATSAITVYSAYDCPLEDELHAAE
jgi:hypothetical protein